MLLSDSKSYDIWPMENHVPKSNLRERCGGTTLIQMEAIDLQDHVLLPAALLAQVNLGLHHVLKRNG